MPGQIQVASTTDDFGKVRAAAGLPEHLIPEEQAEQQEMERQRTENGNQDLSRRAQKRFDKVVGERYAAEQRAEQAERERDELRQRLQQYEGQSNGNTSQPAEQYERGRQNTNGHFPPLQQVPEQSANEAQPPAEQPTEPPEMPPEHARHVAEFRRQLDADPEKAAALRDAIKQAKEQGLDTHAIAIPAAVECPNGPDVLLYVFKNRSVIDDLNQMRPEEVVGDIRRISAGLSFQPVRTPPAPVVSKAPEPVRPLGGHSTRQPVDLNDRISTIGTFAQSVTNKKKIGRGAYADEHKPTRSTSSSFRSQSRSPRANVNMVSAGLTVTGYLVDCTLAPCAAIAQ
jgi:hypothetical protein